MVKVTNITPQHFKPVPDGIIAPSAGEKRIPRLWEAASSQNLATKRSRSEADERDASSPDISSASEDELTKMIEDGRSELRHLKSEMEIDAMLLQRLETEKVAKIARLADVRAKNQRASTQLLILRQARVDALETPKTHSCAAMRSDTSEPVTVRPCLPAPRGVPPQEASLWPITGRCQGARMAFEAAMSRDAIHLDGALLPEVDQFLADCISDPADREPFL